MTDGYVEYLLGRAESARKGGESLTIRGHADHLAGVTVTIDGGTSRRFIMQKAPTLEAALTALLDAIGAEYQPRPSAERVQSAMTHWFEDDCLDRLRNVNAREPATVRVLLDGEGR